MNYFSRDTYVCPTKEQIHGALIKVERVCELYRPIVARLEQEEVEVKSWFGLRRKVMTKDAHIRKENESSFLPYHGRALLLGYITAEEHKICRFMMDAPLITHLKEWEAAGAVYLGASDHRELMFALREEI